MKVFLNIILYILLLGGLGYSIHNKLQIVALGIIIIIILALSVRLKEMDSKEKKDG